MGFCKKLRSMIKSIGSRFDALLPTRSSRSVPSTPNVARTPGHTPRNNSQMRSDTELHTVYPPPMTPEDASIHLLEQPLIRVFGGGTGAPGPQTATGGNSWTYLDGLHRALLRSTVESDPLLSVTRDLVVCVRIYEHAAGSRRDFRDLKNELELLFQQLVEYYSRDVPPLMSASLESICRQELAYLKDKLKGATVAMGTEGEGYGDQVLECYKRIRGHLRRLMMDMSMSLWNISDELVANTHLDHLSPPPLSRYNSKQLVEPRGGECTPGTRMDVLARIRSWIHDRDAEPVFWLNGMAGTGKTTIAYSLCAELESSFNLGASFFCSRSLPECRDANRIVPSIAYQLAQFSRPFRSALLHALKTDPDARTQLLRIQFGKLVAEPLQEVRRAVPKGLVVVIDALDECDDKKSIEQIVETILTMAQNLPVKFFLASRPEPEIRDAMKKQTRERGISELVLHELDKATVQGDIERYIREALRPINPSESDILALVGRAGVLFICAGALVRYISRGNFSKNPLGRLKDVISGCSTGRRNPYKEVDRLYNLVLEAISHGPDSKMDDRNDTEQVLHTVLCAREPLTMDALSGLLSWHNLDRVHAALAPLWSILHILGPCGPVTVLHGSLCDYIFDPFRSEQFHCDPAMRNLTLAKCCFDSLRATNPQFNVCGLKSSCVPDRSVPDLGARVQTMIPAETRYACQYWEQHLQYAARSLDLLDRLDYFLSSQLFFWMEILNLSGYITIGAEMLRRAEEWCVRQPCGEDLKQLAHDAWRFMTMFASNPVSQSTPHIYVSMLPSWPVCSPISKHYSHLIHKEIRSTAIANRSLTLLASWHIGAGISSLTWSPDGTCIAFISGGHIYGCDPLSGHSALGPLSPTALLPGSRNTTAHGLISIGFATDGARIVSGSADGTIYLWDSKEGKQLLEPQKGHTKRINSVVFSPDNRNIASGSEDGLIKVWDAQNGKKSLDPLHGHSGSVLSIAFSPDCTRIVSGSDDRTLRIWDLETGRMVFGPLQGHTGSVSWVVCSLDGTRIASGSYDRTVRVWNAQTGAPLAIPFEGHTGQVHSVAFSPDGTRIISGSEDKTIRMWDAQNGELMASPFQGHTDAISSVAFSPDGTRFASASNDESIRIWDVQARKPKASEFRGHTGYVSSVAFSPNGACIASSSQDKTIRTWDGYSGEVIPGPLQEHVSLVTSLAFSPDGTRIVSGSQNSTVQVWDVQTGQPKLNPLKAHTKPVSSVAFSPDGTRIISGSYDKTIRMWDAYTGSMLGALRGHTDLVLSVAFSPEGTRIASGSDDKTIRVWHAATGKPIIGPLEGHTDAVTSVVFSPDGTRIASGAFDGTIRMWDAQTGKSLKSLIGHGGSVFSVAFSPDGNSLVSGSYDKTVRIWDTQTGQPLLSPFEGHTNGVSSVSFSPDGTRIVSGSYDRTIRGWDARTEVHMPSGSPLTSPFSWELTEDGWVVESGNRSSLLVWVPPDLRHLLLSPRALFVTSEDGYVRLDFESARIGASWTECYHPHVH